MLELSGAERATLDVDFPDATVIRLVWDNLNVHQLSALYDAFPPAEARRIARKLELHHTPKHASWLNMAELELAVLDRQYLAQRLPSRDVAASAAAAWESTRNPAQVEVTWRFTTAAARTKLVRLYPTSPS